MLITLKKILDLLTPNERRRAALLLVMVLVMALLDVIGVASIMPFMAVLANPHLIETNAILARIYAALGFSDAQAFLFSLGVMAFVALVVSLAFKAITTYAQLRFTLMREYSLGTRLIAGYLHQPYAWFLNRHSADLGKTVLLEVNQVIDGAMMPMMILVAQGAVALALLGLLLAVDPKLALIVGGVLGMAYGLIYRLISGFLSRIGSERLAANEGRFTVVSEAFGGIKEVKVAGLENAYVQRFAHPAEIYARHQASASVIGQLPRFALEAVAFGGMLLVVLYLMAGSGGLATALPIIGLYAFAGYRLMPALQQIYGSFTKLRYVGPSLNVLHADLVGFVPSVHADRETAPLVLARAITLNGITFAYPKALQPALKDLNLRIPARSSVGLVGVTGSGKTTTVDLILGLLEPDAGSLEVDGVPIDASNRRRWQRAIGYVPQQIYLADDTVAANIAFGLEPKQIDQAAVERAARIANLHDFVIYELPQGYATTVGERGVRLSGGQRQRIGIARALYHNPQVLILDEATSALDNLTEKAVMEAVHNLGHEITIILIAHRLTTVRECDRIYLLRRGRITAQGTYDELIEGNETFRAMAAR
ncbi:MAG: ABC transporter ATP-binding protein/permease [bacterium]|uniref:ABC transporter ATP-binding protein/permease n=1 Tax=Candidatus Methylomirabilis tolerans TaxID=3123416 RepID=A0AAJ1EI87_9BACT|nr:ABC transporter ATP-binding protein/permease [Candidatus Methylomirabilis sp.]